MFLEIPNIRNITTDKAKGTPPKIIKEKTKECGSLEIYGRSKKKADDFVVDLIKQGKPVSTIRPRTIVGKERFEYQ